MSHPSPINRCTFTFADGRRCRMPSIHLDEPLCHFHWEREHEKDDVARYGAQTLLPDHRRFDTARGINQALARNYELLAQGRLPLRNSTALGYLSSLMLQSLKPLRVEEPLPPPPDTTIEALENEMARNLGELMRDQAAESGGPPVNLSPDQLRKEIRAILPPLPDTEEQNSSSPLSSSAPSAHSVRSLDSGGPMPPIGPETGADSPRPEIRDPESDATHSPTFQPSASEPPQLLDEATLRAVVPGYKTSALVREYYSAHVRPASDSPPAEVKP